MTIVIIIIVTLTFINHQTTTINAKFNFTCHFDQSLKDFKFIKTHNN